MNNRLKVKIGDIEFKNPVTTASGTFGSGIEYSQFVDLSQLGAVTTKGVAYDPWEGNPTPRVAETHSGMLNAIGLQNPGVQVFLERDLPFLKQYDTKVIVNVCGHTKEEYLKVVRSLQKAAVDLLEVNISCPNVTAGGITFGQDPECAYDITKAIVKEAAQPVIMKLSPNVSDIKLMAKAVYDGGANAISLINTLTGMKIDIHKQRYVLANKTGGLSGPAIKPIAIKMVHDVYQSVPIPIIGMGGIMTGDDAIEFILAGATMVAVGTANFTNPLATIEVLEGIQQYMSQYQIENISELIGKIHRS